MAHQRFELTESIGESYLINRDIAPTPITGRTWNLWHIASLWVGMSVCITTYMLAGSGISSGLTWWQTLLAIFLGNMIVLIPLCLNAHVGTKYGIPFPVYLRASFGTVGSNIPALTRAMLACCWFGIYTWIGGEIVYETVSLLWPAWKTLGGTGTFVGLTLPQGISFMSFWSINIYIVWRGPECIKHVEAFAAPLLLVVGLLLIAWVARQEAGLFPLLRKSSELLKAQRSESEQGSFFLRLFLPCLTANIGYWSTLSLNISDFTRFAKSQRDQILGQIIGLPPTMTLFAFVGVAVTCGTMVVFHLDRPIWDPVDLIPFLTGTLGTALLLVILFILAIATLSTNTAANVVSPANDISNINPRRISFRTGGLVTGLIGILILPWKLMDVYIYWLIAYSGLTGTIGGIIICDYFIIRKQKLKLRDLYLERGAYTYKRGFNPVAIASLLLGASAALIGLFIPALNFLFRAAWFTGFFVSFTSYYLLTKLWRQTPSN
jgi:NCS1 family nucleobase:cation symporter-1